MKRIVSAFAVIAIVSGAVAFKSARFTHPTIYCAPTGNQDLATVCKLVNFKENSVDGLETDPCPSRFTGTVAHIVDPATPTQCKNSTSTLFDQEQ